MPDEYECICTRVCDCHNPNFVSGIAYVSNGCPKHNLYPDPDDECPASIHWFQTNYIPGSASKQLDLFENQTPEKGG